MFIKPPMKTLLFRRHVSPSFQGTKLLNDSVRLVILSVTKKLRKEHAVAKRLQRIQTNQKVQPASAFFIFIENFRETFKKELPKNKSVATMKVQEKMRNLTPTGFEDGTVGIWHATTYESFI
ncbi:PREDICTED: uncharacterized protein LOC106317978 [Brassica oleracea var. oleracea]|uniref:uncharacterized protein LOC106317978 n=1 Tax=Brassica oleracea var. oleracea TaxID=109376 RepID=UPI0006A6BF87|nr:PREDICTED: uncharacterized protein LOC106317978 [Brassica oleracea var. oleracea]